MDFLSRRAPHPPRHTRVVLRALLALLLLALPMADVHAQTDWASAAPGTLLATAALHPSAAKHFESSATGAIPRCPACDLAQQTTAALDQAEQFALSSHLTCPLPVAFRQRPATPLAPAPLRGPPTR